MAEVLRTKTVSEPRGFRKVLVAKNSEEILGFSAFAFEVSDFVYCARLAQRSGLRNPGLRRQSFGLMVAMQTAMLGNLALYGVT